MADSTATKKRKLVEHGDLPNGSSHKKSKKEKERHKIRDEKGKGRATERTLADSAFRVVSASVTLSIPPVFAMDPMKGALEMLDSLVMRYVPALRGVMLSHANSKFLSGNATIKGECPFAICTIGFDATVWSPEVGMKLTGKIKLCSPDHIALLVLKTFNVSIPRHHIETENWEFHYGPAENDPELGPSTVGHEIEEDTNGMLVDSIEPSLDGEVVGGSWIQKSTGEKLGGSGGVLTFTVIGLKVVNQMLSLVGSLQEEPFSERHVPQPIIHEPADPETEPEPEPEESRYEPLPPLEESSEDEDPFALRVGKEHAESPVETKDERKRRKEEEKKAKEERKKEREEKRKRKEMKRLAKEEKRKEKADKKLREGRQDKIVIAGKDET